MLRFLNFFHISYQKDSYNTQNSAFMAPLYSEFGILRIETVVQNFFATNRAYLTKRKINNSITEEKQFKTRFLPFNAKKLFTPFSRLVTPTTFAYFFCFSCKNQKNLIV